MLPGYPPSGSRQSMPGTPSSYFSPPTNSDHSTAPEGYPSPLMVHPSLSMYTSPSPYGHQHPHYVTPPISSTSDPRSYRPMIQIPCTAPGSYPHVQQQHPFQLLSPTSLVSNFSDPAIVPQGTPPVIISSVHSSDYSFNMRNYPPLLPRSTQGVFSR